MSGKKYVVTIMNRLYLGDGKFVFYVSHPEIGEYDFESHIFKDRSGKEYLPIVEPGILTSEVDQGFANLTEMAVLPKGMNRSSMKDAIADYQYLCSRYIYYVSKTDQNTVFCIPIDLDDIRDNLNQTMHQINEKGGLDYVADECAKGHAIHNCDENHEDMTDDDIPELSLKDALHADTVQEDITQVMLDIIQGNYSMDDLKMLRHIVSNQQEGMELLLESINLQIEATEKGESSIHLKDEEKKVLKKGKKEEKKDLKTSIKSYIDIDKIFKAVTSTLIAQDEPTRRVITEIARKEQNPSSKKRGLLITGQTGSGKTKMMELIARYLDRPFYVIDATQLTIPGFVGRDIEEELWKLYVQCGKDKEKAEHAIIFIDEIDKKGSSRKDDISGKGVLNVLLPFIEGSSYCALENMRSKGEAVEIDTSNMIIILGGAFTDVYNSLQENSAIGFGSGSKGKITKPAEMKDFVEKAKMPDELMGRVSVIKLNDLDVESIKRIILESDESAIKTQRELFEKLGVKLTFGDDYINAIASLADKRKTGARGLNNVVDETTWAAYGDAYSHLGEYSEIILGAETVDNPKIYQKVYKKK